MCGPFRIVVCWVSILARNRFNLSGESSTAAQSKTLFPSGLHALVMGRYRPFSENFINKNNTSRGLTPRLLGNAFSSFPLLPLLRSIRFVALLEKLGVSMMSVEDAATTSNLTSFPELKGDLVDRIDEATERLASRKNDQPAKRRFFGMLSAA